MGALLPGCTFMRSPLVCSRYFGSALASGLTSKIFCPRIPAGAGTSAADCGASAGAVCTVLDADGLEARLPAAAVCACVCAWAEPISMVQLSAIENIAGSALFILPPGIIWQRKFCCTRFGCFAPALSDFVPSWLCHPASSPALQIHRVRPDRPARRPCNSAGFAVFLR